MKQEIKITTKIRYLLEVCLVYIFIFFCRLIGISNSSRLFGNIAKIIGKMTSPNKTAYKNLRKIYNDKTAKQIDSMVSGVWENLGKTLGEFPYIIKYDKNDLDKYVYISDRTKKNIEKIKSEKKGHIIFSAHLSNWELGQRYLKESGLNVKTVFRPLNNTYLDKAVNDMRKIEMIPKNKSGARQLLKELKNGTTIIMLIDQKMNDGIEVPFFGMPAMTAPAIANLSIKLGVPIIPARVIRKNNDVKFEIEVGEALNYKVTGDNQKDSELIMEKINNQLEDWIREYPEQWFWVHNRWK